MKVAIRYYTKSGNTKKLAIAISSQVNVEAFDVSNDLNEYVDVLFLGSSMYAAGIDDSVKQFILRNKDKIGKIYNFSTAAIATSTYKAVEKVTSSCGIELAKEEFHCKGSFGIMNRNRPNEEDLENVCLFVKQIVKK